MRRDKAFASVANARHACERVLDSDAAAHAIKLDGGTLRPGPGASWLVDGTVIEFDSILAYPEYGTVDLVPRSTIIDAAPSIKGVPLVIEHEAREVDLDNFGEVAHGFVIDSRLTDAGHDVTLQINSRKALDAIKSGARFLSPAYRHVTEARPGVARGRRYTHVQVRRAYDNLSLTATPRAGERSAIKLDSRRRTMATLKTQDTTITTTTSRLDSLRWAAHRHASDPAKTDALKTVTITWDDGAGDTGTLVLPAAKWDQWMAEFGGTPSAATTEWPDGEASGAMPLPDAAAKPFKPGKMDAGPSSESVRLDALQRQIEANERARAVREAAAPYMGGRSLAGLDEVDATLALIGMRTDSATILPLAQQLGTKIRAAGSVEQQAEARGALGMLFRSSIDELSKAPKTDAEPDHDALADLIAGRRGQPKTDAAPVVDSITAARAKRKARLVANHAESLGRKAAAG